MRKRGTIFVECERCGVQTGGGTGHVIRRMQEHVCRTPPLRMPWGVLWLTGGLAALLCLLSLLAL